MRPRSGLAWRSGLTVVNAPGTIDSDYRGEVVVLLVNLSKQPVVVQPSDRVAQMVIAPVIQVAVEEVAELSSTQRGGVGSDTPVDPEPSSMITCNHEQHPG